MKWFHVSVFWKAGPAQKTLFNTNYILHEWPDLAHQVCKVRLDIIYASENLIVCHHEIDVLGDAEVEDFKKFCKIL